MSRDTIGVLAVVLILTLLSTFKYDYPEIDPNDRRPRWVIATWWGLHKEAYSLEWRFPTGETDFEAWCAMDNNGNWYVFLVDDISEEAMQPDYGY